MYQVGLYGSWCGVLAIAWSIHLKADIPAVVLAIAWCLCLGCWAWSYYHLIRVSDLAYRGKWYSPILPLLLFACMPQILSKDLYIYFLQGKLAWEGVFTYTDGTLNTRHPWSAYIDSQWLDCPNHYGPVPMLIFLGVTTTTSIWLATLALRLVFVACAYACWVLVREIASELSLDPNRAGAALILNPVLLIQGVGQTHLDILTCLFVLGFIWSVIKPDRWPWQALSIALLGGIKTLLLPIFLGVWGIYALAKRAEIAPWHWFAVPIAAIGMFFMSYLPMWEGPETLTHPMSYHQQKEPVKSVTELLSYATALCSSDDSIQYQNAKDPLLAKKLAFGRVWRPIVQGLALLLAAWLIVPALLKWQRSDLQAPTHPEILWLSGLLVLLVFILYSPVMHPWYFLLVLPFLALYVQKQSVLLYLSVVFVVCNLYELGSNLQGTNGRIVTIGGTILSVLTYFIGFQRFYLKKEPYDA